MGSVAVIARVMPDSPEVNLDQLKKALKEKLPGIQEIREEPIGFGLKDSKTGSDHQRRGWRNRCNRKVPE